MTTALERGEHGVTSYRLGCRCRRCRSALHRHAKVWWATSTLRRGRDPASYVAAATVRTRIAELQAAGWSRSRIAAAALVAPSTITRVAEPSTRWCSRIVARGVLAVEP